MTPILQIINLSCERDGRLLVENLSLAVDAGSIYQIEGANGSGKTTLLRVLCGLSSRYSGELLWRGQPVSQQRHDFHSQLLYLGHSAGVKAVLTPRENLQWHAALYGFNQKQAGVTIESALKKVGLYGFEDAPCYALSAGQQRRVALARLFIGEARLWILDEPFTAIDKQGVVELEGWIADYVSTGGAVILTTHHELAVQHLVHRISLGN